MCVCMFVGMHVHIHMYCWCVGVVGASRRVSTHVCSYVFHTTEVHGAPVCVRVCGCVSWWVYVHIHMYPECGGVKCEYTSVFIFVS